jgi:hypothetical protein
MNKITSSKLYIGMKRITIISLFSLLIFALIIVLSFAKTVNAGYVTSFGVDNHFVEPSGWTVNDPGSTYQEWDVKSASAGNLPDHGYVVNPTGLTDPTHSVKTPGFKTGTNNFYTFSSHFGGIANISNHGGTGGTHVFVQIGTSVNGNKSTYESYGDGSHGPLVEGHGVGVFWDTLKIIDSNGTLIPGGNHLSALQIAEIYYDNETNSSWSTVAYQELIFEFWLPNYTGDFQVNWDQCVHASIDTLRVDTMISDQAYPITQISPVSNIPDNTDNGGTTPNGGSSTEIPGFETLTLLTAIGAVLILLRRRK